MQGDATYRAWWKSTTQTSGLSIAMILRSQRYRTAYEFKEKEDSRAMGARLASLTVGDAM